MCSVSVLEALEHAKLFMIQRNSREEGAGSTPNCDIRRLYIAEQCFFFPCTIGPMKNYVSSLQFKRGMKAEVTVTRLRAYQP